MTQVLLLLNMPEPLRLALHHSLCETFPQTVFHLADHVGQVDPFLAEAEILMTHGPYLSTKADHVLGKMPKLRWVQGTGTGLDNIIDRPGLPADVMVTNLRGAHGPQMSEAAIASMLALSRRMPRSVRNQDRATWERWLPRVIFGKTVGIVGVGVIAQALAPRCKALGMRVIGFSSTPREVLGFDEIRPVTSLGERVADIDHLVLLAPYSEATKNLVDGRVLQALKLGSHVINLARGGVLDEEALCQLLDSGHLAGAALDVFATEPLPSGHRIWKMESVIVTCHMGGLSADYDQQALPIIETNLRHYIAGDVDRMVNVVRGFK